MDINLRDVDCFLACARLGRLSLAAQELNVAVPTIVKAIRRLEEEFHIELLEPGRQAQLTPWALDFAVAVRGLSAGYADALRVVSEVKAQRVGFRIGFPDPGRARQMVQPLSELVRDHPGLRLKIRMGQADLAMIRAVREGELDIAVMPISGPIPDGCDGVAVGVDPSVPVVRAGHPLSLMPSPELADLAPYGWSLAGPHSPVTRWLCATYQHAGLAPPEIVVENEYASLFSLSLVQANDLLTLAPRSVLALAEPGVFSILPIRALHRPRKVVFLTRANAIASPLTRAFLDAMVEAASKLSTWGWDSWAEEGEAGERGG